MNILSPRLTYKNDTRVDHEDARIVTYIYYYINTTCKTKQHDVSCGGIELFASEPTETKCGGAQIESLSSLKFSTFLTAIQDTISIL